MRAEYVFAVKDVRGFVVEKTAGAEDGGVQMIAVFVGDGSPRNRRDERGGEGGVGGGLMIKPCHAYGSRV